MLGVAAASSGAIRYRFYSRWGIGAGDIARIILFCAMTAGLGLNTLMGLALLLQANVAAKLLGFSQAGAIALGAACLLLTALYVALVAVLRQPLAISRWEIPIPPVKLALAQLSVGTMDFCFVAAALYELLPATVGVGYFAVATVTSSPTSQPSSATCPAGSGCSRPWFSRAAGGVRDRRPCRFSLYLLSGSAHDRRGSVHSL